MKLYVHAFESLHVCLNNRDGRYSAVQHKAFDFTISVGVVKLSGFSRIESVQLGTDCCPLTE